MAVGNKIVTANRDARMMEADEKQCRATAISRSFRQHPGTVTVGR